MGTNAAGGLSTLFKMFQRPGESYHDFTHITCACSPEHTSCGGFQAGLKGVTVVHDPTEEKWCEACQLVWNGRGCVRCGQCRPGYLCELCLSWDEPATD